MPNYLDTAGTYGLTCSQCSACGTCLACSGCLACLLCGPVPVAAVDAAVMTTPTTAISVVGAAILVDIIAELFGLKGD